MRESELPLQLKCPNCGKEMERGYVTLRCAGPSFLFFSTDAFSAANSSRIEKDMILTTDVIVRVFQRREGFRCRDCELVVIDRKKQGKTNVISK